MGTLMLLLLFFGASVQPSTELQESAVQYGSQSRTMPSSGVAAGSTQLSTAGPSSRVTKFRNVRVLREHKLVQDELWVCGGTILDPQSRFWEASRADQDSHELEVDCAGLILAPGYIDLQLNGAFGVDFSNPGDVAPAKASGEEDGVTKVCRGVLQHGVTSIYATIITSSPATYAALKPLVRMRSGSASTGAHILGLHLEGPFITVPGAHPVGLIRGMKPRDAGDAMSPTQEPSPQPPAVPAAAPSAAASASAALAPANTAGSIDGMTEVLAVYGEDLSQVRIITLAPEICGVDSVIRALSAPPHNIVISAGHSRASYSESVAAVANGARLITHLFNAMVPFHHRDPGLIGLIGDKDITAPRPAKPAAGALASTPSAANSHIASIPVSHSLTNPPPPGLFYSLIVDGHHAHPASVKIATSTHPSGAVLVTDAMCAMGLHDGRYSLGEIRVDIKDDMAHVAGTNTLAGSIATMSKCVQNYASFTGCSVVSALEAASLHPAQCMGLRSKGSLDVGMDADMILVDDQLNVKAVWVMGELAWKDAAVRVTKPHDAQKR